MTSSPRSRHNILFVSHSGLDSNSGYHVQYYANQLTKMSEWSSLVAVPRLGKKEKPLYDPLPVQTYDDIIKNETRFSDGRGPDIIHAWTPREHVRTFCVKLAKKYRCRTLIHLEDNEEYLTEQAMGLSWSELIKMPVDKLDAFITPNRFHPVRGWQWLKQADGLTLIIETLSDGALEFSRNLPGNKEIIPALSDFYARQLGTVQAGILADSPQQNQVAQLKRQLFQVQEMMEEYYFKYTELKEKEHQNLVTDNT